MVRFDFKEHYATERHAREAIEDYIHVWEFDSGLRMGPNSFKLQFYRPQIEDRNPTPGVAEVSVHVRAGMPTATASVSVSRPYPIPPSRLSLTPDVHTMYDRYMGYRQGREPLASMAYFCLTVLEQPGGGSTVAKRYGIASKLLKKVGRLSSTKGGRDARKAIGKNDDLSDQDRRFLEGAVVAIIRRAAETAYAKGPSLRTISSEDIT